MLSAGQVEEKKALTYKVMVMRRHGEISEFAFSDKDSTSGIEKEDIVAKLPRQYICSPTRYTMWS